MCGVVGLFGEKFQPNQLRQALHALHHRGPDGRGVWRSADGTAHLGHTRLAIVGIANGAQPLLSEDGSVAAVVNGEFYDWRPLRRDLESKGHVFATSSDSEILIHLYEEYGLDCLPYLRGEFAFVLYDQRQHRVFCARDRFGTKPLVWTESQNSFACASEAKALFAAEVLEASWDCRSLSHVVAHQYVPAERTLFENVHQVAPGSFLLYQKGKISVDSYWRPVFRRDPAGITADALLHELDEATRVRLDAETEVATYLSGGLDSSAITALSSRTIRSAHTAPLRSFGIGFSESTAHDESPYAQLVAAAVGSSHTVISVSAADLLSAIPDAAYFSEGLAINAHLPAKFLLSKAVKEQGLKVVLTGEGADELFGGYPHFQQDLLSAADQSSIVMRNPLLAGVMVASASEDRDSMNSWQDHLGYVPAFIRAKIALGHQVQRISDASLRVPYDDLVAEMISDAEPQAVGGCNRADISAYLWIRWALGGYILKTLGDGTEMAHSLEGRTPFLDHKLFALATQARLDQKISEGEEKWILKQAMRGLIPEPIRQRRKHPFLAPPSLQSTACRTHLRDALDNARATGPGFFDYAALLEQVGRSEDLPVEELQALEPVLMLALSAAGVHTTILRHQVAAEDYDACR